MPTGHTETIIAWKAKKLSYESIKPKTSPGNSLAPKLRWIHNSKTAVELETRQSNFYS